MGKCSICGKSDPFISRELSFCLSCLRSHTEECLELSRITHERSRSRWGLPPRIPKDGDSECGVCVNRCRVPPGGVGVCGVRGYRGKISGKGAFLEAYYDPLPTNCVSSWVCGEVGPGNNLAVFFGGCNFDCLFCQNYHHRRLVGISSYLKDSSYLLNLVDESVKCVCFFGGDPTPYMDFVIEASERIVAEKGVKVCLETNGSMSWPLLKRFFEVTRAHPGIVKFDIKAFSEELYLVLSGASGKETFQNIERSLSFLKSNGFGHTISASTLLVPGYVDEDEVHGISNFLARIDPSIPYSLLAFYPQYMMDDLPPTPRSLAERCLKASKSAGLRAVRLGNIHLLW